VLKVIKCVKQHVDKTDQATNLRFEGSLLDENNGRTTTCLVNE